MKSRPPKTHATQSDAYAVKSVGNQEVIGYYTEAGPGYECWSKNFNMHFGYAARKSDCLSRETMLKRMNEQVLSTLQLKTGDEVLDVGCGLGYTLRYAGANFPLVNFTGFTITLWQIHKANTLIGQSNVKNAVVKYGDFNTLPIADSSLDAAYGLESICHANGEGKMKPLTELYRVLKSGGRFTMMDGFLKKKLNSLNVVTRKMHDVVSENWALPCFPNIHKVLNNLNSLGFKNVTAREISWKIAPSAVHAPFLSASFFLKSMLKGDELKTQNWNNLKACALIFFLGLCSSSIGYYEIIAKK